MLVASELITNAIRHASPLDGDAVTISWLIDGEGVIVRVTDGGDSVGGPRPRVRHPSNRDTTGRGLALVEAIATTWGVEDEPGAKTVWARLST